MKDHILLDSSGEVFEDVTKIEKSDELEASVYEYMEAIDDLISTIKDLWEAKMPVEEELINKAVRMKVSLTQQLISSFCYPKIIIQSPTTDPEKCWKNIMIGGR